MVKKLKKLWSHLNTFGKWLAAGFAFVLYGWLVSAGLRLISAPSDLLVVLGVFLLVFLGFCGYLAAEKAAHWGMEVLSKWEPK